MTRVVAGKALLALAAVLVVLLPGNPAWAHTALLSSDPAKDATLAKAPATVTLTFSQRLNPDFTTIAVSDAARQRIPAAAPAIDGAQGSVTLQQALANGAYTVAYRVVSADGHTVQGSYVFTVVDPALPAAAAPPPAAAPASADDSTGVPLLGIGIGAGVVALAGLLFTVARRRSRR